MSRTRAFWSSADALHDRLHPAVMNTARHCWRKHRPQQQASPTAALGEQLRDGSRAPPSSGIPACRTAPRRDVRQCARPADRRGAGEHNDRLRAHRQRGHGDHSRQQTADHEPACQLTLDHGGGDSIRPQRRHRELRRTSRYPPGPHPFGMYSAVSANSLGLAPPIPKPVRFDTPSSRGRSRGGRQPRARADISGQIRNSTVSAGSIRSASGPNSSAPIIMPNRPAEINGPISVLIDMARGLDAGTRSQ